MYLISLSEPLLTSPVPLQGTQQVLIRDISVGWQGAEGRVGYTLNIVRFKVNSVNDINFKIQTNFHTLLSLINVVHQNVQILRCKEAYMNSVSLMCQGRKPSVLFTGPNFTTNSGSGIFFDSETSTKKANMLSRQSFFSYLLRICMF